MRKCLPLNLTPINSTVIVPLKVVFVFRFDKRKREVDKITNRIWKDSPHCQLPLLPTMWDARNGGQATERAPLTNQQPWMWTVSCTHTLQISVVLHSCFVKILVHRG